MKLLVTGGAEVQQILMARELINLLIKSQIWSIYDLYPIMKSINTLMKRLSLLALHDMKDFLIPFFKLG